MIRLPPKQAAKHGIGGKRKAARIDREARVFDVDGCGWEVTFCGNGAKIVLPFPNSTNTHWRHARNTTYLSADGKAYRNIVAMILRNCPTFGTARLKVTIHWHYVTKAKHDSHNYLKPLYDALQDAGLFDDDEQIDEEHYYRGEVRKPGRCVVTIERIGT